MRGRQLFLVTMAFTLSFSVWGLISGLAPRFKDLYGLSDIQSAIAVAVPIILGSVFRLPMGILADRYGGRVIFCALLAFAVVPAGAIALIHSYVALLVGGFFLGLAGSSFAVGVSFTNKWYPPEKQGLALGLFGVGTVGQSIAVFLGPRLANALSWEAVFWIFGLASLAWSAVFWVWGRDAAAGRPTSLRHLTQVFLHERLAWALAFFYFITFGGFVALGVYLPTLLKNHFGLSLEDAGMRTAGFVLVATAMRPVGGWLADRIGGARVLAGVFALTACLALLLTSSDLSIFRIGALGVAAVLGLGNGAVFKLVPERFPREVGAVTGLVGAVGGLGGFFPPIVLGILKETTGQYTIGFVLLALFALAALTVDLLVFMRHAPAGGARVVLG
ncbi:MAG TPA: MFS transporter [Chloroflexota bacterium]|nr:MFS transporter [Chloroflexota bacterium]